MYAQNINEEVIKVDSKYLLNSSHYINIPKYMYVRLVWSGDKQGHPLAVLLHGRPESEKDKKNMNVWDYPGYANYLALKGFLVLIPTRFGYGQTGGEDIEETGSCEHKSYEIILKNTTPVINNLVNHFVSDTNWKIKPGIVIGESYGGLIALSLATLTNQPYIKASINFSGGDGGSLSHLDHPCNPYVLNIFFSSLGKLNKKPTLWIYSANDRFWGSNLPHYWFDSFINNGGNAQFLQLLPNKNNGHYIFTRSTEWRESVWQFISQYISN